MMISRMYAMAGSNAHAMAKPTRRMHCNPLRPQASEPGAKGYFQGLPMAGKLVPA